MTWEQILEVLKYIRESALASEDQFTQFRHLRDYRGKALPPVATSLPKAVQKCVGGAVIEGISVRVNQHVANSKSWEYWAVMIALGETLDNSGDGLAKSLRARGFNNKNGYLAVVELVEVTIKRYESLLRVRR